ncbi:helix-turn-helix transcriptional regulator [Kurthia sibirica]|uniref:Helix-turn-helix domain-containing protein n=1 Tax=Kurthia sibirica TaxID=202750 RepID=A0A2U3AKC2_9BACL|nr:helix-turn-helix domain-containing protein [Kurthia sibirica]PWI24986.1 hypothetical protein DEX24_10450 [Kurthia sibirica]GEK33108.1 hypothetical protein KSI01_06410 [Kurthia sibirica]
METSDEQFYTQKEVMNYLGVARSTVYNLVGKGILAYEYLPADLKRAKMYTKESVEAYKEKYQPTIPDGYIRISDFAKRENLSLQRVYKLVEQLQLELDAIRIGERDIYHVNQDQQQAIIQEVARLKGNSVKTDFYNSRYDVALFQLFIDEGTKEEFRVVLNAENEWGITDKRDTFYSIDEAMEKYNLKSAYTIHRETERDKHYIDFALYKGSFELNVALDFFYEYRGIENMHVDYDDEKGYYKVSVKAAAIEVMNEHDFTRKKWIAETINKRGVTGEMRISEHELKLVPSTSYVSCRLDNSIHERLVQFADERNMSIKKATELLLTEAILKTTL